MLYRNCGNVLASLNLVNVLPSMLISFSDCPNFVWCLNCRPNVLTGTRCPFLQTIIGTRKPDFRFRSGLANVFCNNSSGVYFWVGACLTDFSQKGKCHRSSSTIVIENRAYLYILNFARLSMYLSLDVLTCKSLFENPNMMLSQFRFRVQM